VPCVLADKVVLTIQVGNPTPTALTKEIRVNLPPGIGTNEIINLDRLDIAYDIKKDIYYVHKNLELKPKGTPESLQVFNVEFKDIWVIPETKLDELQKHAESLLEKLKGRDEEKKAEPLKADVARLLEAIRKTQTENSIRAGVKTTQHIKAYDSNMLNMGAVLKSVGVMENLVLATGQDPGKLEGDPGGAPMSRREVEMKPEEYKTAIITISLKNVSTEKHSADLRRDLPPEVRATDILETDGLEIRTDLKAGICYVSSNKVELAPGETRTFSIKIRDKWNVNFQRFPYLRTAATNMLARSSTKDKFKSIEDLVQKLLVELDEIEKEPAPAELNDRYVAFYRRQAARLDAIEQKIYRVETALKPFMPKMGFNAPPPNPKTTWMIIWTILGFLFFLSLVFFFRWYGRNKAEKMTDEHT